MTATTVTPPAAQRRDALTQANDARVAASHQLGELGRLAPTQAFERLADLLANPPRWLQSQRVWEVVLRLPGVGERRAERLLAHANVPPWLRVGRPDTATYRCLTPQQRARLTDTLRNRDAQSASRSPSRSWLWTGW
jgi:hypothetical protein